MNNTKIMLLLALGLCLQPAHAILAVRAGYGINSGNPTDINNTLTSEVPSAATVKALPGYTVDAIFSPPLIPLGIGLRYEMLGASLSTPYPGASSNMATSLYAKRLSAVLDYRLIDTLIYLGGIGTYGLSNSAEMKFNCPACGGFNNFDAKAGSMSSYSVGVEGGVKLLMLTAGAEVGYSSIVANNFTANGNTITDSNGANVKMDLNGMYLKVLVGLGF